jgi:hypothetical protein
MPVATARTARISSAAASSIELPRRLLSTADLAALWGVQPETILKWAACGVLPRGSRYGKAWRWSPEEIRPLLAGREGLDLRSGADDPRPEMSAQSEAPGAARPGAS